MPKIKQLTEIVISYEDLYEFDDKSEDYFRKKMSNKNSSTYRSDLLKSYFAAHYNYFDKKEVNLAISKKVSRKKYAGQTYTFYLSRLKLEI